jgi:phage baseplate assembly protein W
MVDKDDIPFRHWSLKVARNEPATGLAPPVWGEVATAVDDLHQSIANIVMTPLCSVPTEPEKGCDLLPYLDRPTAIAIPQLGRAIWDAITIWEPRIVLQDVRVVETAFAQLTAEIYWRPVQAVLDDALVTRVSLNAPGADERRVA